MKLPQHPTEVGVPGGRRASGFTMVEVAIALAVIGFALVAIIGILPAGLNVQRENREETIINQEASLWMDAIRSGAQGMNYLVDHVDMIRVRETYFDASGLENGNDEFVYTPYASSPAGYELTNGRAIVGLISAPRFRPGPIDGGFTSNHVEVYARAVSGSATEVPPQDNPTVRESAFSYRLTVSVAPFYAVSDQWYDYHQFLQATGPGAAGGSEAEYAQAVAANLHDIRLDFQWPLRPPLDMSMTPNVATNVGSGELTFRALCSGSVSNLVMRPNVHYAWLQPRTYVKQ